MTEKLALELALVLPDIPDERDSCIQRLTDMLQAQGIAVLVHEGATVLVVLNALRLLRFVDVPDARLTT